ncbi:MAG: methionine synthase [Bacteroidetes bacterium 4572_117]|nr:MAG: methionine synthase [Bacteroidetes bacterium 4572_117]
MKKLLDKLKEGQVLLSDGAWGTMLFEKGLTAGECPELWNITNRDKVFEIAQSYIKAGADIIETNSFGSSGIKLELFDLADRAEEINIKAAEISRDAAGNDHYVFGSIGPSGKILMMGDVTEEQLYKTFSRQSAALEKGGADAIIIETITALDEAMIAIRAAKENTGLPVVCTFTFDKTVNNDFRTMMGVSPTEMTENLINSGVDIIGTNCGNGFDGMLEIVKEIRQTNATIPLMVQANAGLPQLINGQSVFPESPDEMAAKLPLLIDLGVNTIGGCCGTTPKHIAKFAEVINNMP